MMVDIQVQLDEQLKKELRFIDRNLINKATLKALRSIAKPVLRDEQRWVPADTQVLRYQLSISSFINNKNRDVALCHVGLSKKHHPAWLKIRGLAMEYGNIHVRAQPFLSKAADQNRTPVYQDFRRFLNTHLDKLVAKA